jgi:hypothetical protein
VARLVQFLVVEALNLSITLGRNDELFSCGKQRLDDALVGVESLEPLSTGWLSTSLRDLNLPEVHPRNLIHRPECCDYASFLHELANIPTFRALKRRIRRSDEKNLNR